MNIFFLALTPSAAAKAHCDKHVVKMIIETVQLLDTAHGSTAWVNHPCAIWARESKANYHWLACLGMELCEEFARRYHKTHAYKARLDKLLHTMPYLPNVGITRAPIVVASDCLLPGKLVESYRQYYRVHKSRFAKWTSPAVVPEWFCTTEERYLYQK